MKPGRTRTTPGPRDAGRAAWTRGLGALALCWAFVPARAEAHAPPLASDIVFQSGPTGDARVVVRTNRGLLVSNDGGATFSLLCNEALGFDVSETPALAPTTDGRLLLATTSEGLLESTTDLCDWTSTGGPGAGLRGSDVIESEAQPTVHYLVTAEPTSADTIFAGTDNGASWQPIAPTSDVAYTRIRAAPSDAQRLYRAGVGFIPGTGRFHQVSASFDGGTSWTDHDVTLGAEELQLFLLGVDPGDAETIYARTQATSSGLPERLLVSRDAGQNFEGVLTTTDLLGFAIDPIGGDVWAGGADGLWRSTDGGATFSEHPSPLSRVTCLVVHDGALYACAIAENAFGVSVSWDGGATFERYLSFADVRAPLACAPGTRGGDLCDAPFQDWEAEVLAQAPDAGGGGSAAGGSGAGADGPVGTGALGGGGGDRGTATQPGGSGGSAPSNGEAGKDDGATSESSGGCSCEMPARRSPWQPLLALFILGAIRRRRRPSARLSS